MIKKIAAAFCLFAVLLSAGCRLAKEESSTGSAAKDHLIGVFVTTEHLDLFDFEGYIKDNPPHVAAGGEIKIDGDSRKYNGRLYATPTVDSNGHTEYAFNGVNGVRFFEAHVPASGSIPASEAIIGNDGICDTKVSAAFGDNQGQALTLEGTIYVTPATAGKMFCFNPVYQDAKGNVYVMTGSGSTNSGKHDEGMVFSQSYKESYTETENGKKKTDDVSVTVTVNLKNVPEKLVILQMDNDHSVLARDEYAPGAMPDSVTPQNGAAYIIAESTAVDSDGKKQISRALYGRDAQYVRSYHDRGDGILIGQDIKINWQ